MKYSIFALTVMLVPAVASAQYFGGIGLFFINILNFINDILVPLIFGLALLVFIYGMFKYFVLGGASEEERKKGQQLALWAVIGFVLMVSIWGIVNIISAGLLQGVDGNEAPNLPGTPTIPAS